jgi:hypothetical protein
VFQAFLIIVTLLATTCLPGAALAQKSMPYAEIENGKFYVYWGSEQIGGPYQFARVIGVYHDQVLYYTQEGGHYYVHWDQVYGPYYEAYKIAVHDNMVSFVFQPTQDKQYYLFWGGQTAGPYLRIRKVRYENGKLHAEVSVVKGYETHITIDSGRL